jgi:hypothetical protein
VKKNLILFKKMSIIKKYMNTQTIIGHLSGLESFDDIYDVTKNMDAKEKGDLFEIVTFYLFKLSPLLNCKLQDIWMYKDIPSEIMKTLKLPKRDKGIDILAKIDNEYYAIQSKFRQDTSVCITWDELSTFFGLTFGLHDRIKGGFFATNTYDMCDQVNDSEKVVSIRGEFFDVLPDNFFKNICDMIENKNIRTYVKKEPYSNQLETITG